MRGKSIALGLVTALWLAGASAAQATVITPTTTADDISNNGNCTLREAIQAANTNTAVDQCPAGSGADIIKLGEGAYTLSVGGQSEDANQTGDLDITAPVTIEGTTTGAGTTIDAQQIDRAIDVLPNAPTTVKDLTIANGRAPHGRLTGAPGQPGGGIRAQSALTLIDVSVDNCDAGGGTTSPSILHGRGGTGFNGGDGGGIWTDAQLAVSGGSFGADRAGNGGSGGNGASAATDSGGSGSKGGSAGDGGSGGAIHVDPGGALSVTGTSFSQDFAGAGGTGGSGGNGAADSMSANAGNGGDGGNAGSGGSGGAISVDGTATLSRVSTQSTAAGAGGDAGPAGVGGALGVGGTGGTRGQNGRGGGGGGGGVVADSASLTLDHSLLTGSSAGAGGDQPPGSASIGVNSPGPGGAGGAITGTNVTVVASTITNAHAGQGGQGEAQFQSAPPPGAGGGNGGAIFGLSVTLTNTTISHSQAGDGGSGRNGDPNSHNGDGGPGGVGGGVEALDNLTMAGVTLDHDRAGAGGAGGRVTGQTQPSTGGTGGVGGGAAVVDASTITNSTFTADAAGPGGAGAGGGAGGLGGSGGGLFVATSASVSHATIAGNTAGAAGGGTGGSPGVGGGISGPAAVSDSVISGNGGHQCAGTSDGSRNVSFPDPSCGGINANPKLRALAANSGPTQTMLLGIGSPAFNAIPSGGQACSGLDQRGVLRPQGGRCDSGAVEMADPAVNAPTHDSFGGHRGGTSDTNTIKVRTTSDPLRLFFVLQSAHPTAFKVTANHCRGRLLQPHTTCRISIRFKAAGKAGGRSGALRIEHNTPGPPVTVRLIGSVKAKQRR